VDNKTRIGIAAGAVAAMLLGGVPAYSQSEHPVASQPESKAKMPRAKRKASASAKLELAAEGQFGGPLPGLTEEQLDSFADGLEEFQNEDTPESGLGPTFNDVSCAACHSAPAIGGSSTKFVTRFGRRVDYVYDSMAEYGGSLLQSQAIDPAALESVPPEATIVAIRRTTPLFGFGLIEAIPDAAILQNAVNQERTEVRGRAAIITDVTTGAVRVGRFGWKAQQATLLAFAGDAYLNEMGITDRFFPNENAPNGNMALLAKFDLVADPEDQVDPATGRSDIDKFADFMRLLGPPPPVPLNSEGKAGQQLFAIAACDICHVPTMQTGSNAIKALDHQAVPLYSDLLLHNMGPLADDIGQADASPDEIRTPPLWGLRGQTQFLHDGRAKSADEAIRLHDGDASASRQRYVRLPRYAQQQILAFLNSI
jgi:CxxC motif-containing protein (DUF1111 family)